MSGRHKLLPDRFCRNHAPHPRHEWARLDGALAYTCRGVEAPVSSRLPDYLWRPPPALVEALFGDRERGGSRG